MDDDVDTWAWQPGASGPKVCEGVMMAITETSDEEKTKGKMHVRRGLVDSGATSVMRQNAMNFQCMAPASLSIKTAAENTVLKAAGQGTLALNVRTSTGNLIFIELEGALVVPNISTQLTAVSALVDAGHAVIFTNSMSGFFPFSGSSTFIPFVREGNLWYLEEYASENCEMAATGIALPEWERLHLALVHLNPKYMTLIRNNAEGLDHLPATCPSFPCHICIEGKMRHANKAPMSHSKAGMPFELVHVDTAGPYRVEGIGKKRYFSVFTDDYSRYRFLYTHRTKDEIPLILKKFLAEVGTMRINGELFRVRCLRSDNGGEYTSAEFEQILLDQLIRHEYSNAHEHFQLGRAERSVGLISQSARLMHLTSGLPKKIWPFAVLHAVYILNRVPTKANKYKTPYEELMGKKPNLKKLKIFGSLIYGYVHKVQSSDWKMDARGIPMAYIGEGLADGSKAVIGYKLGKEGTGAIVYTTSYWSDPTFLPCRPKTDRRLTSCSFGSYPDLENEMTELYTIPSGDDLVQTSEETEITLAELQESIREMEDQGNQVLLDSLRKQVEEFKKHRQTDQSGFVEGLSLNQEDLMEPNQTNQSDSEVWELIGYEDDSDKYLVQINNVTKIIDSQEVHERIACGQKVACSVLGVSFDAFDDESETLIAMKPGSDSVEELDIRKVKDKLRSVLNDYFRGSSSFAAYTLQSQTLSTLLTQMKSRTVPAQINDRSEMISASMAVEEFTAVMRAQRKPDDEPSMGEALRSPEKDKWIEAIREEINKLTARGVFRFISKRDLPADKRAFPLHIVLKRKRDQFGEVTRYKARCVLDGSQMRKNVDYFESYAPVVDFTNVRLLVSIAHAKKWELRSYDIVLAFTLARPQVPTFVRFRNLEGIVDGIEPGQIAEVLWNLYGDVAAPYSWYQTLKPALLELGFVDAGGHPCVMIRTEYFVVDGIQQKSVIMLTIYVDDLIVAASGPAQFTWFETKLGERFEFTTQGRLKYCLGVEFQLSDDSRYLTLTQRAYALKILEKFKMQNCRGAKTPVDPTVKLSLADCPQVVDPVLQAEYRAKVGSLQYLCIWTRPDLSYAVSLLSRFLHAPGPKHLLAVDRALQYLKDTVELGITYVSDPALLSPLFPGLNVIIAYSDSDFAGCLDTSKSMTGYVVMMNAGAIAWKSSRQATIALATSAAETVSMMKVTVIVKHLRQMLHDLDCAQEAPTPEHLDNKTSIIIGEGKEIMHQTAKHVTVQSRYVMECVQLGSIVLLYIPSREQRADIFTKALSGTLFRYHRDSIMGITDLKMEQALLTVRVADVPKSTRVLRLIIRFRQFHQLLIATQWALLAVGFMPSMKHKQSMYKEDLARYDRLLRALTKRIIAKGKGWLSVVTSESPDASSGSVGLAGRSCGQSCEQSEAPKISSLQSGRNIDLADGSPVTATAAVGLVSSGAMERQLCDAPAGESPAAADFETVDN